MTLPGFTAEASDYRSSAVYAMGGAGTTAAAGGAQVAPQFRLCTPCINIPFLGPRKICVDIRVFPPRVRFSGIIAC